MNKNKRFLIFAIFLTLVIVIAVYVTFLPVRCRNYECFRVNMAECNPATYINEEPDASWGYEVIGPNFEKCRIDVTLLQAKEGDLGLLNFEGNKMSCYYPRETVRYPEEDLGSCTGLLKENMQERVIEKLHEYILENLGEIRNGLNG